MRIVFILDSIDESLYFVELLFWAVSKTNDVDSYCILLQFLCQNFQSLEILTDSWSYETDHSLFLSVIWSVFQRKSSDLDGLHGKAFTCEKWSSPLHLIPNKNELALVESEVGVHSICTCFPPMRPTPTDDCWLASSFAWMRREAASTCPSHLVGS